MTATDITKTKEKKTKAKILKTKTSKDSKKVTDTTKTKEKKIKTNSSKDLKQVQDHYLDYPYPHRNPEDEKTRLLSMVGDHLGEINHFLFEGKENFTKNFRVLVAGGGTGDAAIYHAEQLKSTNAEIVYLDFSKTSMGIAQKRAKIRNLTNITWVNDSILNIPDLKLGKFDFINCVGVLHHLESPDLGLSILRDALKDNGGMSLMVYAKYGRTGVYQVQELMQMINDGEKSRQQEVRNGWDVVNQLPNTNWYSRGKDLLADHIHHGDSGMYDMFLHKQDRSYSVPELFEYIENAGLHFADHSTSQNRIMLNPSTYQFSQELREKITKMDVKKQQAVCEIMCGSIIKHSFYVSKNPNSVAQLSNLNNVPYMYSMPDLPQKIADHIKSSPSLVNKTTSFGWKDATMGEVNITFPVSKYTESLFANIQGDKNSLREIFHNMRQETGSKNSDKDFLEECNKILPNMINSSLILLRNKDAELPKINSDVKK